MKVQSFDFQVENRNDLGKGASRRLRRQAGKFPAIIYGGNATPLPIMLDHNKFMHALKHEQIYTHILTLHYPDQSKQQAILKSLHRHPYKAEVMHADFQRVQPTDKINIKVPLHFINEDKSPGVKKGGLVNHHMSELIIRCEVAQLPEFISVDLSDLDLDKILHISDLKLPESATSVALHDLAVVSIHMPRTALNEQTAASKVAATAASEPKKDDKENKNKAKSK